MVGDLRSHAANYNHSRLVNLVADNLALAAIEALGNAGTASAAL